MEDFLGKLFLGIIAWIVALFVVELIAETIEVIRLSIEEIRNQLKGRRELVDKGVSHVIISDFIKNADKIVVKLDAYRSNGSNAGKITMCGKYAASNIQKGTKILTQDV